MYCVSRGFSGLVAASAISGLVVFSTGCVSRATDPDVAEYMPQGFLGGVRYWSVRPVPDPPIFLGQLPV